MDDFLKERIEKYDRWLGEGKISFSSKVIPVGQSLEGKQWVLPTEQALNIVRNASTVALKKCLCREHYSRCDNPLDVCLVLNDFGDKFVADGTARPISISDAADVLQEANDHGLVHLSLYMPDHQVGALCSCCSCCCHDLQIVKLTNRKDLMVRSEYVASTDPDTCTQCGDCVERCLFGARVLVDEQMKYDSTACLGCGLCVTVCPVQATTMEPRTQ